MVISGHYVLTTKIQWILGSAQSKPFSTFHAKPQKPPLPKKKKFSNLSSSFLSHHQYVNMIGTTMNMVKIGNVDATKAENKVL